MTATERAKRSDALYYETVSVNRRVLCDMVANRESDLEDAKAENEHMRIKAIAVVGELQEENERLKAENAKLRELLLDVWNDAMQFDGFWDYVHDDGEIYNEDELPHYYDRMRELGLEVR